MPCERTLKPNQTIAQRVAEVKNVLDLVTQGITAGRIKLKIGPTGAPVFIGIDDKERDAVTDVCIYRRLLATGTAKVKAMLSTAPPASKLAMAQGHHSHDGGASWHTHK